MLLPPCPRQLEKGAAPLYGVRGNHNAVTPHCVIKNHPPGKKNKQLNSGWGPEGLDRDRGAFIWQKSSPHQDHCATQRLCSGKEKEQRVKNPKFHERKSHYFPRALFLGAGICLKENNVAK